MIFNLDYTYNILFYSRSLIIERGLNGVFLFILSVIEFFKSYMFNILTYYNKGGNVWGYLNIQFVYWYNYFIGFFSLFVLKCIILNKYYDFSILL